MIQTKVRKYIQTWLPRGYPEDIPDEVPNELMQLGLAPSYKAICLAILQNDHALKSLGFAGKTSVYYTALKRMELQAKTGGILARFGGAS